MAILLCLVKNGVQRNRRVRCIFYAKEFRAGLRGD